MENPNELLLSAAKTGDVAALARALKAGADRETKGSNDWTALILSAFHNRAGCLSALIEAGSDPNAKDITGWTASMRAASNGHADCLSLLIQAGADMGAKDRYGWNAARWATNNGYADCMAMIESELDRGALAAETPTPSPPKARSTPRV